jgi:hypothetical protein
MIETLLHFCSVVLVWLGAVLLAYNLIIRKNRP